MKIVTKLKKCLLFRWLVGVERLKHQKLDRTPSDQGKFAIFMMTIPSNKQIDIRDSTGPASQGISIYYLFFTRWFKMEKG
jgi:hypothetical protein